MVEFRTLLIKEEDCKQMHSRSEPSNDTYCEAVHDGLLCWPPAISGSEVKQKCPPFEGLNPNNYAYRICGQNASWEEITSSIVTIGKTNFAECMLSEESEISDDAPLSLEFKETAQVLNIVGIVLLSISVLCVIVVLLLNYCILPKFVTTILHVRVRTHLFVSIILDTIVKLISQAIVLYQLQNQENTLVLNDIIFLCEFLATLHQYTELSLLSWMALDSHFVQMTSKSGYLCGSGYMIYCVVGWALPVVPTTVWVVTLAVHHKVSCWRNYSELPVMWIVDLPKLCFLLMIIVMLAISGWRLHKKDQKRKVYDIDNLKSDLVMTSSFSFLVLISVLLVMIPMHVQVLSSYATQHVATIFTSSRGTFVSILYAFINRTFMGYLRHNEARIPCKKYLRIL